MPKILLHTCCGPCSVMPLRRLSEEGFIISAWFDNPNIHPYREWVARKTALEEHCRRAEVELLPVEDYGLTRFLREVAGNEADRCVLCYRMRLASTAKKARESGQDAFSTTLLYSRYQNHDLIRETAEDASRRAGGIPFLYRDWRADWQAGVDESRRLEMYRQPYCGCVYSEEERYRPKGGRKGARSSADGATGG